MFAIKIVDWYKKNKRILPWRNTKNPYFIWLSEIILQQTRVNQGLPYYNLFIEKFPTIRDLALSEEQEVLRAWQGLGYYSRARNIHFTAKYLFETKKGEFPDNFNDLRKLKGVGDYTAAAIASFAFEELVPAIDGNAIRVLSRFFEYNLPVDTSKAKKDFFELGKSLMLNTKSSDFNQAVMELGALVCTPTSPNCHDCPLNLDCLSFSNNSNLKLPIKSKKIKVKNRAINYLVFIFNEKIWLKKRETSDIWANLYDFYSVLETDSYVDIKNAINQWADNILEVLPPFLTYHLLTHQKLTISFFPIILKNEIELNGGEFYEKNNIDLLPKPKVIENFLSKNISLILNL